jgi:2-polyprenyl-6-methoxyphenol hydroxylase-like FAD-dependent oxidoreductase
MDVAVVGAGPTGLYLSVALARRGHRVTVVDRDTGPAPDGSWPRRGVMQFHHPHAFRGQVVEALLAELPEVWDALLAAGAEPAGSPEAPGQLMGVRCRRMTFERVLRAAAVAEPGVMLRIGHAEAVLANRGRAAGVRVDGAEIAADLVVDASGRAGRLTRTLRSPGEGGPCGSAYVSRQYALVDGAGWGPLTMPIAAVAFHPGYGVIVFPHDNGVFSTVFARPDHDDTLARTREEPVFDAVAAAVPLLAAWTDPIRARPITPVLPGGPQHNAYRGQRDDAEQIPLPGLICVGDAVCTTNPAAGRGVTTSLMQARRLVALLDEHGTDHVACAEEFDAWCEREIRPWFADHVEVDAGLERRWAGEDIDLTRPLPSDLIAATAQADPSLMRVVGPYFGMRALPDTLRAIEARAREIYASGWRPPVPEGPTRDELVALVERVSREPVAAG